MSSGGYRRIEPGACTWCGHPPHDGACIRTIRTRIPMPHGEDADAPCPCRKHEFEKDQT